MADYLAGEEKAFSELIHRYETELYNFLYKFTGNAALAEEVFQETFLQVHLAARTFDLDRRFKPWLYTIAANRARDFMRKQSRRPAASLSQFDEESAANDLMDILFQHQETPDRLFEEKQMQEEVRRVIAAMPEHLRMILLMAYYQQLSYKEMSDALEIPLGTVKSRLHAAVGVFARLYKKENESHDTD